MSSSSAGSGSIFNSQTDLKNYLARLGPLYLQYAPKLWDYGVRSTIELAHASAATLQKAGVTNDLHVDNIKASAAKEHGVKAASGDVAKDSKAQSPPASTAPAPTAAASKPASATAAGTSRDAGASRDSDGKGKGAAPAVKPTTPAADTRGARGSTSTGYGAANKRTAPPPAKGSSTMSSRPNGPSSAPPPSRPTGYGAFRMPRGGRGGPEPWAPSHPRSPWPAPGPADAPPRPYSSGEKRPASAMWAGGPPDHLGPPPPGPGPMGPPPLYNPPPAMQAPPFRPPEFRPMAPEPGYRSDGPGPDRRRLPPQSGYPSNGGGGWPPPTGPQSLHNAPPVRDSRGPPPMQQAPMGWQPPPMQPAPLPQPGPGPSSGYGNPPASGPPGPGPYMGQRPQSGYGYRDGW